MLSSSFAPGLPLPTAACDEVSAHERSLTEAERNHRRSSRILRAGMCPGAGAQ